MRFLAASILCSLPLLTWGDTPIPDTILAGPFPYILDGGGSTIDATTLPSLTGYFMLASSLDMSNVTLQNFHTFGGVGSGGGAGLGGTLFINTGVTVNLSNVNFIASTVTGGDGGVGDAGGVLNNLFVPFSDGTPGADGSDANVGSANLNAGNGLPGRDGVVGGVAIDGFGGSGGKGGLGANGASTYLELDQVIADVAALTLKSSQDSTIATAQSIALAAYSAAAASQLATFDVISIALPLFLPLRPWVVDLSTALAAQGVYDGTVNSMLPDDITPYDFFKLAEATAFNTAFAVTAYQTVGFSGNGGDGGYGAPGGAGSFGFGGGRGGDGGDGGDAVSSSIAAGGRGGFGGRGGLGGFGGGGGRGGDLADSGANGTAPGLSNGDLTGWTAPGGTPGFGGGKGSFGNDQITSDPNGTQGQGGSGFGGAIFIRDGGILNINGPATFCSNFAQEGGSQNGGTVGKAAGSDLFMMTGSQVTLNPGPGNTVLFGGSIADDSAATLDTFTIARGFGANLSLISGFAVMNGTNTYSGQTSVSGGAVFQAVDGIGLNASSNLSLDDGIFQSSGTFTRYLGTNPPQVRFSNTAGNGFSAAGGDLTVSLNCGGPLTWGQAFFLGFGQPFLFGSPTATNDVIVTNAIDLAGAPETLLATASTVPNVRNQAIFTGILSNGGLIVGDLTHTGIVTLAAANTYLDPTQVSGGTLLLTGSIQSTLVTIDPGATLEDVNAGLLATPTLNVDGTFILDSSDAIDILTGGGTIELNGGTLTINSGTFTGPITATDSTSGITKVSGGTLTLSGASTYVGPTTVNGGTLTLTGSLQSQTISIAPGAVLDDVSGGLSSTSTVTANGSLIIGATQTIGSLFGSGSVDISAASLTVGSGDFSGVISGVNPAFSLTKNTGGTLGLSGANTYVGPTLVTAGTLILSGSLASTIVTVSSGATLEDVNGGLSIATVLTADGTVILDTNQTIQTLNGASTGFINLTGGTITVGDGAFAGTIAGIDPSFGLTKTTAGTLTLTGPNTYAGPTNINQGTLTLSGAGTLASPTVNVAVGATLNDNNGGLSNAATLTNDGLVNLPVNDTILALINSGTINGAGTLTAPTYALNNGSLINANLGTGVITSNGTVQLNGTTSASTILIQSGTMTLGGPPARLLALPDVTADGTLVLGANEAIDTLLGSGAVALGIRHLTVNNGTFSGVISGNASSQLIKVSSGLLTLSGANTYTGITQINAGELTLTGSLASLTVNVAAGATLDDNNSGLAAGATLTNAGLVNLPLNDTILALINSGTINGAGTLTATTYTLNNGSLINANLGTGVLTTNVGVETLNGTSAAGIVTVNPGSTFNLGANQRLSSGATLTVNGILNLPLFDQTVNILNGLGGQIFANNFQVNNGGTYNGLINATTSFTVAGGVLNLNGTVLNTSALTISPAATLNFTGAGTGTTNTVTLGANSILNVSNGALINNSSDVIIPAGAQLNAVTGGRFLTGGNIFLNTGGSMTLDATGRISANTIQTQLNSLITVPDSSRLTYNLLTGFGTVNSLGGTFVNNATVTGEMIFLNSFTNLGTLSPGFSPGLITIGGNYTEGGHLILDILTTTAITGYDQVRVGGVASLLPTSVFDVHMSSSVIVPGNFFQVIATSAGGPIPVSGLLGSLTLTVDGAPTNPNVVIWDAGTGRILITGIGPTPPGPPGPNPKNPFFNLGCTKNQDRASKGIFSVALITPTQIDTSTVAGQLAAQILAASNPCDPLSFYAPTYYGAMSDYAFMGDRAMASQVWNRVSAFISLPEACRPRFSSFLGYIDSEANKFHKSDLQRQDIYVGVDYSTCRGFSLGFAISESKGKIKSHMGKSQVEGNTGIIYLRKSLGAYFTAFGTVSGSSQDNHLRRPTYNGHVKARSQSKSITGNVGVEFTGWQVNCFSFAPRANIVYSYAHVDKFKEKGAIDAFHNDGYHARFVTGELGMSTLCSTKLWSRPFDIEATVGIEQPFKYFKGHMDLYLVADPAIAYSLYPANTAKTRLSGGLNFGYNLFRAVTLYGGYEVITGGDWNHIANAGIRMQF